MNISYDNLIFKPSLGILKNDFQRILLTCEVGSKNTRNNKLNNALI